MPRGVPQGMGGGINPRYSELALATDFDGVNDRMEVAFGSPVWPATGYTMMGWLRLDVVTGNRMVAGTTSAYAGDGLHLYISGGSIRITFRDGLDLVVAPMVNNRRYHVAMTVDAARNYIVYIDAEARMVGTMTLAQLPTIVAGHFIGGTGLGFIDGRLADWAFFARPLSLAEIQSVVQRRSMLHLAVEGLQGRYPLDQLIASGPNAGRSPDTSGLERHLTLFNMPVNPIVTFPL